LRVGNYGLWILREGAATQEREADRDDGKVFGHSFSSSEPD